MKKFIKVVFVILCYSISFVLALVSGAFTILFYSENQQGIHKIVISGLAISFEVIKYLLAITYPFMKNRNYHIEKRVKNILNISLILSVLASMYFFIGSDINISPASKIIDKLFPQLNFLSFLVNMSLSIIIEYLIIYLPSFSMIFFYSQREVKQEIVLSDLEKLLSIPKLLISRQIENLYNKVNYIKNVERDIETLRIEEVKDVENVNSLENENTNIKLLNNPRLDEFLSLENLETLTNAELENVLNVSTWELRKLKEEAKKQGLITIENKKIRRVIDGEVANV